MLATIDFWFSVGSTYTYLTVMRLDEVSKSEGIEFNWRPFSVRVVMTEQNNIPFRGKPIKMAYMWRDIERRASMHGLPVRVPAPYGLTEYDLVNKIAILGREEGWCRDYIKTSYRRWFQEGQEISLSPYVEQVLREIGQEPDRVFATVNSVAIEQAYKAATDEARSLNVFGSPTFVVAGEVFWGDDRLDDAIEWARNGTLERRAKTQAEVQVLRPASTQ
jgi:2-hydroxychromene-2-carboxylate isomerase